MEKRIELGVPSAYSNVLTQLQSMGDATFDNVLQLFQEFDPALSFDEVVDRLVNEDVDADGIVALIRFAISTRSLLRTIVADVETVASAVAGAFAGLEVLDERLKVRLRALLDSRFIATREKALWLEGAADLVVDNSFCLTDARPVFSGPEGSERIVGCVVLHTLRIDVRGSRESPIYVTLGSGQLTSLKAVIDRAQRKEEELRAMFDRAGVDNLTVAEA